MNLSQKSSCNQQRFRDRYITPYERLLRRNQSWTPTKVKKEQELQDECRTGQLNPFQQPENYSCHFIHEKTDIVAIDQLIEQAKSTTHFSMDTENDALTHKPATLQVEFIRPSLPSTIIIVEVQYLPSTTTLLFKKIQELMTIIFTSNHYIYSWGPALKELSTFHSFNLFNTNINIKDHDIQNEFSGDEKAALQKVVKNVFHEYLNKTATLAEWACGIDLFLGTYLPEHVVGPERTYRIKEEKYYRSVLKDYALNDVFAVTKLCYKLDLIKPLPTADYEDISEEEENHLNLQDELSINLSPTYDELIVNAIAEPGNINDNMDLELLPDFMILHFNREQHRPNPQQYQDEQSSGQQIPVHVSPELSQVRDSSNLGEQTTTTTTLTAKQKRNRKTNLRHRRNRYRYEVKRHVYHRFNVTKIKRILKSMNIFYININLVRNRLFMGLKTREIADEVEYLLNDHIFTQQHYRRLYR
ncbi:unnamed protein product [Rotaria sp. Silwood2]|nr:unnamed protein product [Rotaria sp. Silwood2]CAF4208870.1 unnamed protein product [Rotaria sp. Silwood2]CAF4429795.1 unnamed protein product [Rotaria sp. Silwood2]